MLALGAGPLASRGLPAAENKAADMAIARWKGPKELDDAELKKVAVQLTRKAIEGIGGLGRFVKNGDVVWVKPNMGWDRKPETAANTNPDVFDTVIKMCFDAGAKVVKVGDNPVDLAAKSYEASGLAAVARNNGAQVFFLDKSRFRETKVDGERLKSIPVWPAVMECDLVINVPVAKHHGLAEATLCMKNFMGVIEKRNIIHQAIPECLADLVRFMKPRLSILDAVRVLLRNGPKGGNLADVKLTTTVAAGVDIVALDAFGAELLGRKPRDVKSIVKGEEAGLGKIDYRSLALKEIAVS